MSAIRYKKYFTIIFIYEYRPWNLTSIETSLANSVNDLTTKREKKKSIVLKYSSISDVSAVALA